ncbi:8405_t:CDS:2, partial [Paraglomus occultum]
TTNNAPGRRRAKKKNCMTKMTKKRKVSTTSAHSYETRSTTRQPPVSRDMSDVQPLVPLQESKSLSSAVARPSINQVNQWCIDEVIQYLQGIYPNISEKTVRILEENEVDGYTFLNLTKEELVNYPYNMAGGPAFRISKHVQEFKV